jgi:hypothetical protein
VARTWDNRSTIIRSGYYLYRFISFVQRWVKHISVILEEYQMPGEPTHPARNPMQINRNATGPARTSAEFFLWPPATFDFAALYLYYESFRFISLYMLAPIDQDEHPKTFRVRWLVGMRPP